MLKLCITQCQNILDGLMPITFLQYCSFGRRLEPGIGIDLPIQMGVVLNCRVNVSVGPQEDRMMTSGRHTVADIYCNCCQQLVGWKYESAYEKSQKYKEGKFILERAKMIDGHGSDFYSDTHQVVSDAEDE
jgi:hypothetical protein